MVGSGTNKLLSIKCFWSDNLKTQTVKPEHPFFSLPSPQEQMSEKAGKSNVWQSPVLCAMSIPMEVILNVYILNMSDGDDNRLQRNREATCH